jgi:drug/metabolite transporter (DMT)-like permease
MTTVATATALVNTTPIWSAIIVTFQGVRLAPVIWIGIAVAVTGAVLATGSDFAVSTTAVTGDLLALAGGAAAAVYTAFGVRARAVVSTTVYTTICYSVCALALLATCLVTGSALTGYAGTTWLAIAAITVFPQLLGHNMINYALNRVPATTVNVLLLLEAPGAAVLGWLLLDQLPTAASVPGLAILIAGVAVVLVGAARTRRATTIGDAGQPAPPL